MFITLLFNEFLCSIEVIKTKNGLIDEQEGQFTSPQKGHQIVYTLCLQIMVKPAKCIFAGFLKMQGL